MSELIGKKLEEFLNDQGYFHWYGSSWKAEGTSDFGSVDLKEALKFAIVNYSRKITESDSLLEEMKMIYKDMK